MAVIQDETRKQLAAGSEDQGIAIRTFFDPFNVIIQQLGRLDDKLGKLDEKIDTKMDALHQELKIEVGGLRQELNLKADGLRQELNIQELNIRFDGLHQEVHSTTRWIIGTTVAVAGVAVALAAWLFR